MDKKSTLLKIGFLTALLISLVGIQYGWIRSIKIDKLQKFQTSVLQAIEGVPMYTSLDLLKDNRISNVLHLRFSSKNLANVPFEFSFLHGNAHVTSPGFNQQRLDYDDNLVLYYPVLRNGQKKAYPGLLTIVVPNYKDFALQGIGWFVAGSIFLSMMILAVLFYGFISVASRRNQRLFYANRIYSVENMLAQLETPISTVSVAAEALHNEQVMRDPEKMNFYKRIISQEGGRMKAVIEKFARKLKSHKE